MKYLKQFSMILMFSFIGELLRIILPFPIPASVYGLVTLLAALLTGVVKTAHVKDAAVFLIEIMPVMFIPAAAGLLTAWDTLRPVCLPVIVITFITTILVMGVTGRVTQWVIRRDKKWRKNEDIFN